MKIQITSDNRMLILRIMQAHDGEPVEAQKAGAGFLDTGHVRPPGSRAVKVFLYFCLAERLRGKAHDGAHIGFLL